jgi:hypothetical protein
LIELKRRSAAHNPLLWQLLGLALIVLAVGVLAGPWWGVLLAGVLAFVGGMLREAGWI